ncbi:MAG: hypothetical protein J6I49_08090 [Bacteroidales bacterium]|nr:hypothetical protein [Bacteroidales bacterium]
MKRRYIKPTLELFLYEAEEGYGTTVALHKDYVLVEGNDNNTLRSSEEIVTNTDADGEYETGGWLTWK